MFFHRLLPGLRRIATLFLLVLPAGQGYSQVNSESQLKAAFLVNFLKYVEWPASTATNVTICLFGRDRFGAFLSNYEGRTIGGRELWVRRVNGPDHLDECQVLFIPDTEEARFSVVLRWVENQPTLTVSDAEIFAQQGGAIALVRSEGRLQFDINLDALNRAGLKPHSQMMRLARQVSGAPK